MDNESKEIIKKYTNLVKAEHERFMISMYWQMFFIALAMCFLIWFDAIGEKYFIEFINNWSVEK